MNELVGEAADVVGDFAANGFDFGVELLYPLKNEERISGVD